MNKLDMKILGGTTMNPTITSHSYEALASFQLHGICNCTYSGIKDLLLGRVNKSSNKQKISEPVMRKGFNYQEMNNMPIRVERLETLFEEFVNKSCNAIDGKEAARFLGVSKRTLDSLVAKNEIPSYRIGSRRLYRLSDLAKYRQNMIENNRQQVQ